MSRGGLGRSSLTATVVLLSWSTRTDAQGGLEGSDFFEKRIRPVLAEHCYKCHSHESEKVKGGLLLDSREGLLKGGENEPVVIPGDVAHSRLIEAIRHENDDLRMPPKYRLSDQQIADFVAWVKIGAPGPKTEGPNSSGETSAVEHWAFKAISHPAPPPVKKKDWVRTPVDAFILQRLEGKQLSPAPPADKRTLLRRATYDLTGLPPTPEELEAFLRDASPGAFGKVVDRLLTSPRYGERWGRYWLDVARYADTKGYVYSDREESRFVHSAAYRDWVIRAFNRDMPYDRFLLLQMAADQIGSREKRLLPTISQTGADVDRVVENPDLAAMGFLTLGRRFLGVVNDIIDDRIDVVMRGTQALTVGCARCHDHKFDPIPTRDYYSLYGIFAGCSEGMVALAPAPPSSAGEAYEKGLRERIARYRETYEKRRAEFSNRYRSRTPDYLLAVLDVRKLPSEEFYEIRGPDDINPTVVRSWENYLRTTRHDSTHVFALWHQLAVIPADDFSVKAPDLLKHLAQSRQSLSPAGRRILDALQEKPAASMRDVAVRYGELLVGVHRRWQSLIQSAQTNKTDTPLGLAEPAEEQLRQALYGPDAPVNIPALAAVDLEWYFDEPARVELMKLYSEIERWIIQSPGAPPHSIVLEDRPAQKNPRVFVRGNPANQGPEVPRQFLGVVAGEKRQPFKIGSGRLEMARAIASQDNPLTARVMVNRVWLHHFGNGLVRTPSDFGMRSEAPTHPELLDWLARRFMEDGWSLKRLHRLLMLSAVYQQSSAGEESSRSEHPETEAVAAVGAGRLNASPVDPENRLLWHFNRQRLDFESLRDSLLSVAGELDLTMGGRPIDLFKEPFSTRRTVYGFIDRQFLPGLLRVFDFANPDMHNPQRPETSVPQQALFLMNSPFVNERSRALARRACRQASGDKERVDWLYRTLFQRPPSSRQLQAGLDFIRKAESEPPRNPPEPATPVWLYGYGQYDEANQRVGSFEPLPYFTGDAWQGGESWPDQKLGWVRLTADGGHAGNDPQHAAIRRWVAPFDTSVAIAGSIRHEHKEGDGIQARIVSSHHGSLGNWKVHNGKIDVKIEWVQVKKGDTLDFVVDFAGNLNSDDFKWMPVLKVVGEAVRMANSRLPSANEWNAKRDFSGPAGPPPQPLNAWESYAQVLLLSNEFMFVD